MKKVVGATAGLFVLLLVLLPVLWFGAPMLRNNMRLYRFAAQLDKLPPGGRGDSVGEADRLRKAEW